MRSVRMWLAGAALVFCAVPGTAQDFLLNSAETITPKTLKITGFPALLMGDGDLGEDDSWGFGARVGYGITASFDIEAKASFFDGLNQYGADAEYWLLKGDTDLSVAGGFRLTDADFGADATAIDTSLILSRTLADKLEPYVGFAVSFESLDDLPEDVDSDFRRVYLVPGAEYRVRPNVNLVAEFGIGLNDNSADYLAFGVSFYVR